MVVSVGSVYSRDHSRIPNRFMIFCQIAADCFVTRQRAIHLLSVVVDNSKPSGET